MLPILVSHVQRRRLLRELAVRVPWVVSLGFDVQMELNGPWKCELWRLTQNELVRLVIRPMRSWASSQLNCQLDLDFFTSGCQLNLGPFLLHLDQNSSLVQVQVSGRFVRHDSSHILS